MAFSFPHFHRPRCSDPADDRYADIDRSDFAGAELRRVTVDLTSDGHRSSLGEAVRTALFEGCRIEVLFRGQRRRDAEMGLFRWMAATRSARFGQPAIEARILRPTGSMAQPCTARVTIDGAWTHRYRKEASGRMGVVTQLLAARWSYESEPAPGELRTEGALPACNRTAASRSVETRLVEDRAPD